jgi:hypothetical protein
MRELRSCIYNINGNKAMLIPKFKDNVIVPPSKEAEPDDILDISNKISEARVIAACKFFQDFASADLINKSKEVYEIIWNSCNGEMQGTLRALMGVFKADSDNSCLENSGPMLFYHLKNQLHQLKLS